MALNTFTVHYHLPYPLLHLISLFITCCTPILASLAVFTLFTAPNTHAVPHLTATAVFSFVLAVSVSTVVFRWVYAPDNHPEPAPKIKEPKPIVTSESAHGIELQPLPPLPNWSRLSLGDEHGEELADIARSYGKKKHRPDNDNGDAEDNDDENHNRHSIYTHLGLYRPTAEDQRATDALLETMHRLFIANGVKPEPPTESVSDWQPQTMRDEDAVSLAPTFKTFEIYKGRFTSADEDADTLENRMWQERVKQAVIAKRLSEGGAYGSGGYRPVRDPIGRVQVGGQELRPQSVFRMVMPVVKFGSRMNSRVGSPEQSQSWRRGSLSPMQRWGSSSPDSPSPPPPPYLRRRSLTPETPPPPPLPPRPTSSIYTWRQESLSPPLGNEPRPTSSVYTTNSRNPSNSLSPPPLATSWRPRPSNIYQRPASISPPRVHTPAPRREFLGIDDAAIHEWQGNLTTENITKMNTYANSIYAGSQYNYHSSRSHSIDPRNSSNSPENEQARDTRRGTIISTYTDLTPEEWQQMMLDENSAIREEEERRIARQREQRMEEKMQGRWSWFKEMCMY